MYMKFSTGLIYDMSGMKGEFRENWSSDGHTVRKNVRELLPVLSIFIDRFW